MNKKTVPLISVIIAVYNGESYLQLALDSILGQTFKDFELIIVNDASTDNTREVLSEYADPRITLITNETNLGQTVSLNKGLAIARGQYIARHDADDISHPDRFQIQVNFLDQNPDIGLLGTSYEIIDFQGRTIEIALLPTSNDELKTRLQVSNIFCHGSIMMRKNCLEKVGGYNEAFRVSQDYDLWLRMSEHCQLANLSDLLYKFRFTKGSITAENRDLQLAYLKLAKELAHRRLSGLDSRDIPEDVLAAYPPEPFPRMMYARWNAYLSYASGQTDLAKNSLLRAQDLEIRYQMGAPISWENWANSMAIALAELREDINQGAEFIIWVFTTLSLTTERSKINKFLGRFYADRAFRAYQNKARFRVLYCAWKAIVCDSNWLLNRGLLVVSWKSLLP